jgi:hypothetical protein
VVKEAFWGEEKRQQAAALRMTTTSPREACDGKVRCDDVGTEVEGEDAGKAAASRRAPKKFRGVT